MPEEDVLDFRSQVQDLAQWAFSKQGWAAFECPKSAACVHEAGHATAYSAEGDDVLGVSIFRRTHCGLACWLGETSTNAAPKTGPDTDPYSDLKAARGIIAGVAAEQLFEGTRFRFGSSLDEVATFTNFCANAAMKLGRDQVEVRIENFAAVARLLADHGDVVVSIATALAERGRINGRRLTKLLAPVRRHAFYEAQA
jgi:hypothetical protein